MSGVISVRVTHRPLKFAFCVAEGDFDALRRSIRLTCTLWGGRYNPIIPIGPDPAEARTAITESCADLLAEMSGTPEVRVLTRSMPWLRPALTLRDMFHQGGLLASPPGAAYLDVTEPLRRRGKAIASDPEGAGGYAARFLNAIQVAGNSRGNLSDAMLCIYGDYPAFPGECPVDYRAAAERSGNPISQIGTQADGSIAANLGTASAVSITTSDLSLVRTGFPEDGDGILFGEPDNFRDLLYLWNLRAAGRDVMLLPSHGPERTLPMLRFPGRPDGPSRQLAIYCRPDHAPEPNAVKELSGPHEIEYRQLSRIACAPAVAVFNANAGFALAQLDTGPPPQITAPLQTELYRSPANETQFLAASVQIPGPTPGFVPRLPPIPRLNPFYGQHFAGLALARSTVLGTSASVQAWDHRLEISPPTARGLLHAVLKLAGAKARASSAGKVAERAIAQMGGLEGCAIFRDRGVRELLTGEGWGRPFTRENAINTLRRAHGGGPDRSRGRLRTLLQKGALAPGIRVKCPACQLRRWYRPRSLGRWATCPSCDHRFNPAPFLPERDPWVYNRSGVFASTPANEGAVPVALALLTILEHHPDTIWATGTEVELATSTCEADALALVPALDGHGLLLIECKTGGDGAEALAKMTPLARDLRAAEIPTFLMLAKATGEIGQAEADAARRISDALGEPAVVMLEAQDLAPPPAQDTEQGEFRIEVPPDPFPSLSEWAADSEARHYPVNAPTRP